MRPYTRHLPTNLYDIQVVNVLSKLANRHRRVKAVAYKSMPKAKHNNLTDVLRAGDLAGVKSFVRANPKAARAPQAICEAARLGFTRGVEFLVRNGADLNASWRNYRPLHSLIQEKPHSEGVREVDGRVALLNWMLAKGADPEQLGGWPAARAIITAAMVGEPVYVEALRRGGAVVDTFVAAALGDVAKVEKALVKESGFASAIDPSGLTALHCAAGSRLGAKNKKTREGLVAVARLLLDRGANVDAGVKSWGHDVDAVYFAVASGQREVFALLLERGADPTRALTPAVWSKDIAMAEMALDRGAKLDRAVDEGKPLLNHLIRWGQFKQALWMLERGASPNVTDEQGWTAAHQAASRGNEKMLKAVLDAGGDASLRDKGGYTPLDIARARNRPRVIALLAG